MDADGRIDPRVSAAPDAGLDAWLSEPPLRIGMRVRAADGGRVGVVCGLTIDARGGVIAVDVAFASILVGRRRIPRTALRAYGDGLVCLCARRDLRSFPAI